jgi:hypothetical protein
MARIDFTRDYYGDLELPVGADVNDVKKQFRKLGSFPCPAPKSPVLDFLISV